MDEEVEGGWKGEENVAEKGQSGEDEDEGRAQGVRYFNGLGRALNASIIARVASRQTPPHSTSTGALTHRA